MIGDPEAAEILYFHYDGDQREGDRERDAKRVEQSDDRRQYRDQQIGDDAPDARNSDGGGRGPTGAEDGVLVDQISDMQQPAHEPVGGRALRAKLLDGVNSDPQVR